eukprot:Em0941g1a
MDFGEESELEDLIEEIREQSNESYYPFPSKIFALLYLLVNSPHPMCLGRPDIAGNLVRYPIQKEGTYTELFHGSRWHTDLRFYSPMVMLADETSVFVNDCVSFYHPTLGSVSGKVTKFFHQSDSITEVYARIDMLLDLRQFQRMVPDTTVMHLHSDTLIHAVRWIAPVNFVRMDEEETLSYFLPHSLKLKAAGKRIVMVPLVLFYDSGNKSKKWHKFESWSLVIAGLPRHFNARKENIHFISCSDKVSSLELCKPIAQQLTMLETDGVVVFDALNQEEVLWWWLLCCALSATILWHLNSVIISAVVHSSIVVCVWWTGLVILTSFVKRDANAGQWTGADTGFCGVWEFAVSTIIPAPKP